MTLAAAGLLSCTGTGQSAFDPASVADASGEVTRVEPLSWWTGMQTSLQLLVNGAGIAAYDVRIEGGQGVGVKARHKADSPNYLFVDVEVKPDAEPGTYYLVFSQGERQFKVPYQIAARAEGSAARKSFTTADMIYLLMPDRFANGDASNDSTPHTRERALRPPRGRPAGDDRPPGLHRRAGRHGRMAHAAVAGRRTRRFVPRLRLRRLLPHRPPVRLERTV